MLFLMVGVIIANTFVFIFNDHFYQFLSLLNLDLLFIIFLIFFSTATAVVRLLGFLFLSFTSILCLLLYFFWRFLLFLNFWLGLYLLLGLFLEVLSFFIFCDHECYFFVFLFKILIADCWDLWLSLGSTPGSSLFFPLWLSLGSTPGSSLFLPPWFNLLHFSV